MILLVNQVNLVNIGNLAKWMDSLLSEFYGCIFEWMGNLKFLFHFLVCKNHLVQGGIKRIGGWGALFQSFFGKIMLFYRIELTCHKINFKSYFVQRFTLVSKKHKSKNLNGPIASIGRAFNRFLTSSLEISKISIFNTKTSFFGNYFHCTAQVYRQYQNSTHSFFGSLDLSNKDAGLQSYLLDGWKMFIGLMRLMGKFGMLKQHTQPRSLNLVPVSVQISLFCLKGR